VIVLHTWKTPNGRKPAIMLEETGLPYRVVGVDLGKNEQFSPEFLDLSPNNKVPAIVDEDSHGIVQPLFESGAILTYLAEKSGQFLAPSGPARWAAMEWLHWQIGGLGPMLGQLGFYALRSEEKAPLPIRRFTDEAQRLLGVMEKRLAAAPYLAGAEYSIADIAAYPWTQAAATMLAPVLGDAFLRSPAINAWLHRVAERPAVSRGMAILND
jgi:GST-like protein